MENEIAVVPAGGGLSVKEIAERLGVHPSTVRTWIRRGKLPACRVGGAVRVPVRVLQSFVSRPVRLRDDEAVKHEPA